MLHNNGGGAIRDHFGLIFAQWEEVETCYPSFVNESTYKLNYQINVVE